jgi:hypothetical protein
MMALTSGDFSIIGGKKSWPAGAYAHKGMVRSDMSKPALLFFFTARIHTTKSTVKILAANTHCKYFLKIAEVIHFSVRGTACIRDLYSPS